MARRNGHTQVSGNISGRTVQAGDVIAYLYGDFIIDRLERTLFIDADSAVEVVEGVAISKEQTAHSGWIAYNAEGRKMRIRDDWSIKVTRDG